MTEMDLGINEAHSFLMQMSGQRFGDVFSTPVFEQFSGKSKGQSGNMIESLLGKDADTATLDFYDGELKSYDADSFGIPKDVIKIKMINSQVDWMLNWDGCTRDYYWGTPFAEKLSQILFQPVDKSQGGQYDWIMMCPFLISQYDSEWSWLYEKFASDMYEICMQMQDDYYHGNKDGDFAIRSTTSRREDGRYLFLKTGGSTKPTYTSDGTMVSPKSYALYMTKMCIEDILSNIYYDPYYRFIDEYENPYLFD